MVPNGDGERGGASPEVEVSNAALRGELVGLRANLEEHLIELEAQNEELARVRDELEKVGNRYIELFERAPLPYLSLDARMTIEQANREATRLLGDDLVGSKLPEYLSEIDADRFQRFVREVLEGKPEASLEVTIRPRNGQEFPARLHGSALPDGTEVRHVQLAIIDLTSTRLAQAQLAQLIEAAPNAMVLVDESHRITLLNRRAELLFGRDRSELVGESVEVLVPPELREAHVEHRQDFRRGGGARRMGWGSETVALGKDGARIPVEIDLTPVETSHGTGVLAAIVDVSARRHLEEEIRQAQKMEALGSLASGIAHDFNNLLMAQSGCAAIALSLVPPESPVRMYLKQVARTADTGAAITRRLLDFARRDNGDYAVFDLHETISKARPLVDRLLGEDIEIRWLLEARGPRVRLRRGEIEQVLINLASNARDAMQRGGTLTIATRDQTLTAENPFGLPAGRYVRLEVGDSGDGMSEETRRRAFEPLFTTKATGKGTGLGLSTVFSIARQADGRVTADSELDQGTLITVILPVHAGDELVIGAPKSVRAKQAMRRLTLLLVEDDAAVRMAARFFLEELGHQVLAAKTGDEAIECSERYSGRLDALLTDVVVPGPSGSELVREIRALRPKLPVLYMSALSREALVASGRIEPEEPLLAKPFHLPQLELALWQLLSGGDDWTAN